MPSASLGRLRLRLTLWYLATLCGILLLLGFGLFFTIRHQITDQREASLRQAVAEVERAAQTREREAVIRGPVADAVQELRIPGRTLYLLDTTGAPIVPQVVPDWVRETARAAGVRGEADLVHHVRHEGMRDLYAERFTLASGHRMVAAAEGDLVELEERYASLIAAFGVAALTALVLVAAGGWLLVRKATAPIEANIGRMRRFMADAAHELRTPITVLRTQAEVALQRTRDADAYVHALQGIESESRRLGRIVDDLLILARADSGERQIHLCRCFLDDIVVDVVEAAGPMATTRGLTLTLTGFEEAAVDGDPELLRQLVVILIDNAIKFTPSGGRIDVDVGPVATGAVLTVADTGPGILPAELPHIFERFYRSDPARHRQGPESAASGAGLGLSIANWIAEAHHATISVDTEPGRGTTFSVRFPGASVAGAVSSS
ncbi:MAG: sensor histidine kinase [Gemmatimonadales bacterium]